MAQLDSGAVPWDVALLESCVPPLLVLQKLCVFAFCCCTELTSQHLLLLQVQMGNLNFLLGRVQYDTESQLTFPLEAQIGLGVGASFVALVVLVIVFIYR